MIPWTKEQKIFGLCPLADLVNKIDSLTEIGLFDEYVINISGNFYLKTETVPFSETASLFRRLNDGQSPEIRPSKRTSMLSFISDHTIYSWFQVIVVQVSVARL